MTVREIEILRLMAVGKSDKEIGSFLDAAVTEDRKSSSEPVESKDSYQEASLVGAALNFSWIIPCR